MEDSLDSLKQAILAELEEGGFAVFLGESRSANEDSSIFWDVDSHPDFRAFLRCATKLRVPLVVLHSRTFKEDEVEDALQDLDESVIEGDELQEMTNSLREMNAFAGLVGTVDLSYDFEGRTYFYYVEADWYREFLDLRDEIDVMTFRAPYNDDESGESMGGYFSRN